MAEWDFFIAARVLHVIGVVLWIGGVAFIVTVLLPTLRRMPEAKQSLALFGAVEGRFKSQAKFVTLVTGLSGMFMLTWLHAWNRYLDTSYWWVHLMTFIWIVFTLMLFVLEPAFLSRKFRDSASRNPEKALRVVHRLLSILLILSLIAILGAVLGVHS